MNRVWCTSWRIDLVSVLDLESRLSWIIVNLAHTGKFSVWVWTWFYTRNRAKIRVIIVRDFVLRRPFTFKDHLLLLFPWRRENTFGPLSYLYCWGLCFWIRWGWKLLTLCSLVSTDRLVRFRLVMTYEFRLVNLLLMVVVILALDYCLWWDWFCIWQLFDVPWMLMSVGRLWLKFLNRSFLLRS